MCQCIGTVVVVLLRPTVQCLDTVELGDDVVLPESGMVSVRVRGDGYTAGFMDGIDGLLYTHTLRDVSVDTICQDVSLCGGYLLRWDHNDPVILDIEMCTELVMIGYGDASDPVLDSGLDDCIYLSPTVLRVVRVYVEIRLHLTPAPSVISRSTVA